MAYQKAKFNYFISLFHSIGTNTKKYLIIIYTNK